MAYRQRIASFNAWSCPALKNVRDTHAQCRHKIGCFKQKNNTTVINPTTNLSDDCFYINSKIFETKSLGKIATKRTMQANMSFIGIAP